MMKLNRIKQVSTKMQKRKMKRKKMIIKAMKNIERNIIAL